MEKRQSGPMQEITSTAADVRFESTSDRLYIKASGVPAAFGGPETWLFEYDLRQRNQTGHAKVDPSVLPQECTVSNAPAR